MNLFRGLNCSIVLVSLHQEQDSYSSMDRDFWEYWKMCVLAETPINSTNDVDMEALVDTRAVDYLMRKASNREWNQPKRKKFFAITKDERWDGDLKTVLTSAIEMQNLEFAQLVSYLSLGITVKWSYEFQKRSWTLDFYHCRDCYRLWGLWKMDLTYFALC